MNSRIAQLIARGLTIAAVWVAAQVGLPLTESEQASFMEAALQVGSAIVILGGVATDLLIHKFKTGGVMKPAGTVKTKG
jgi:hypothetical protein